MKVALTHGILKCISTDSIREVMRTFDAHSPALHRSSYQGAGDPVLDWRECCDALSAPVDALVADALRRGVSLVLEGVHVVPDNT